MLPNADRGAITGIEDKFTRTLEKKNYSKIHPKNHDLQRGRVAASVMSKKATEFSFHRLCIYRIIYSVAIFALYRVLRRLRVRSE